MCGKNPNDKPLRVDSGDRVWLMRIRVLITVLICLISPKVTCLWEFGKQSNSERQQVNLQGSKAPLLGSSGLLPPTAGSTNNCSLVNNNDHPFRSGLRPGYFSFISPFLFKFQSGQTLQSAGSPFPEAAMQMSLWVNHVFRNSRAMRFNLIWLYPRRRRKITQMAWASCPSDRLPNCFIPEIPTKIVSRNNLNTGSFLVI